MDTPADWADKLGGFRVVADEHLKGQKRAVKSGDTVYVSPAMYDLISHAEGDELDRLLDAISYVDIGEQKTFENLPMIFSPRG